MYKVIEYFTDLHDKDHEYRVGDLFPRDGITVSEERIRELAGNDNKRKVPLIEEVEEEKDPPVEEEGKGDHPVDEPGEDQTAQAEPERNQENEEVVADPESSAEPAAEAGEKKSKGKGKTSSK